MRKKVYYFDMDEYLLTSTKSLTPMLMLLAENGLLILNPSLKQSTQLKHSLQTVRAYTSIHLRRVKKPSSVRLIGWLSISPKSLRATLSLL